MSLRETGILTTAELKEMGMFPSEERMRKGPVAIAECVEHIPCNPCETSCPFHAICVGDHISNLPNVDCSGLAIFIMDKSYSDTVGSVSFPYEYVTPYKVGDQVKAADRSGKHVCDGVVKRIILTKKADRTPVVTLEVPIEFVEEVRSIYREHA